MAMDDKILRRWHDAPDIRSIDAENRTVEFVDGPTPVSEI